MPNAPQSFIWYELMTTDVPGAEAFYKDVVGWNSEAFPGSNGDYIVVKAGEYGVGGLMKMPENAGPQPAWVGYIHAPDVDAAVEKLRAAGGKVHRPGTDIPGVGRFAVVADPQGAVFMLLAPQGEAPANRPAPMTQGLVAWHELYAAEWQGAFDFYAGQFGWTKDRAMDMGPMGTYQLFAAGGEAIGGMMTKPEGIPAPAWLYYFIVGDIDAAAKRVTGNKGRILNGPMEVPGGWILQCTDPQGAHFALSGSRA